MKIPAFATRHFSILSLITLWITSALLILPAGGLAAAAIQAPSLPESFSELAESVSPAVVNVRTETTTNGGRGMYEQFFNSPFGQQDPFNDFFEKFFNSPHQRPHKQRSLGSGFIIDEHGFIVTNNHVVENADEIVVKLKSGEDFPAEILGTDPNTDLALLKIEVDRKLPHLELGDSDKLKVGQWVVAIGSPFGLEQTVTAGIVSAKGRVIGAGPYDDFIQTDASINPGNSGGPLLNLEGQVVGINTAIIASGQGIGFAIPANLASNIISQLKTKGEVTRGWLGVRIQPVTDQIAEYYDLKSKKGALVTEVFPGDPADKAGIRAQDIILKVNGEPIDDNRDLSAKIANIPVGDKITIELLREGRRQTVTVEIAQRDESQVAQGPGDETTETSLGITVADITEEVARKLNLNSTDGVYVKKVEQDSKAARIGIRPGDVIREINREKVGNSDDYRKIMDGIEAGETFQMVVRKPNGMYLFLKMTK